MSDRAVLSGWGRTAPTVAAHLRTVTAAEVAQCIRLAGERGLIARGLGRSYGDAAQNAGGTVLAPIPPWQQLEADGSAVRVSAGTILHDLMRWLLPQGRFVTVTPGTRFVTVGGAIASDIHGKNHHVSGSFGDHVRSLELVTADGTTRVVGPDQDPEVFWATVGGMGLTGIITSAVLDVLPVQSAYLSVDTLRIANLAELMARMRAADREHSYSVAWIDTLARGRSMGRSVLTLGDHASRHELTAAASRHPWQLPGEPRIRAPRLVPGGLVSRPTVRAFNEVWFRKAPRSRHGDLQTISSFFHLLDGVAGWNRLYGRAGLVQYQFVVPDAAESAMPEILGLIAKAGHPSFLAVLKRFGPGNPGLLSFPTKGWTLALDMPTSLGLRALLDELDRRVVEASGRVYLAKDSRMSPATFEAMYPRLDDFRRIRDRVDPTGRFQSDLSRRLCV